MIQAYLNPAAKGALARQAVALGDAKTLRNYLDEYRSREGTGVAGVVGGRSAWRLRLLHLAVFEGSVDTVLLLLSAGASPNAQDLDGWTPLHYAARNEIGGEVLVRTLLTAGAEVDRTTNRGRTALHIGYLSRNFPAVSELLEHGASTVLRDTLGKTPPQMLELSKPVRRRPWSGSSAIPGGSQELSACRRGLPCRGRPRTATGDSSGSRYPRTAPPGSQQTRTSLVAATHDRNSEYQDDKIDAGDSLSTLQRSSIVQVHDESVLTVDVGRGTGLEGGGRRGERSGSDGLGECWRCHREMAILEGRHHPPSITIGNSTSTGITYAAPSGCGGGGGDDDGRGKSSFDGPCGEGNIREDDHGVWGAGSLDSGGTDMDRARGGLGRQRSPLSPEADTRLDELSAFELLASSNGSGEPTRVAVGEGAPGSSADSVGPSLQKAEEASSLVLSRSHLGRHNGEDEENVGDSVDEAGGRISSGTVRGEVVGMGKESPTQRMRRRKCSGSRGGGRKRGGVKAHRGVSPARAGRRHGRAKRGISGGVGVPGRRSIFRQEDEVPEYVVGRRRMLWAQRSAARYAQRTDSVERRREEIASPRRLKVAAAVEEEKRRVEEELKRKERVWNSPRRWGRDGRPQGSPIRPFSSPAAFPSNPDSPTSTIRSQSASPSDRRRHRPATAGPYGGRSCIKCDPRWWFRGEFVGELGGPGLLEGPRGGGLREGIQGDANEGMGGGLWNKNVTDRYRVLRLWAKISHEDSELWWAKPRMDGNRRAVVVKVAAEGSDSEESWKDFAREWGVLKYLQEEGRLDGREPLCVGLAGAFAKERVLVLSIPAGSRTLRDFGQELHTARRRKKKRISDEAFFEQVESLAVQACRAICWLHRCGLISGDANPYSFVLLGGAYTRGGNVDVSRGRARGGDGDGTSGRGSAGFRWEGELRLATVRSVARRSETEGGCPRHPLMEPITQSFPVGKPLVEPYASPERMRAAAYDVPFSAEIAEDAWGLGMTIHWLLTGEDHYVPNNRLQASVGGGEIKVVDDCADSECRNTSPRQNIRPACPGKVCSLLPDLLSPKPREREIALGLAGRHAKLLEARPARSPSRTKASPTPDTGSSTQCNRLSGEGRLALLRPISPQEHGAGSTDSRSLSVSSPPPHLRSSVAQKRGDLGTRASEEIDGSVATSQDGERAAPSSGDKVGERTSDTPEAGAGLANTSTGSAAGVSEQSRSLKSVGVGTSPTTKTAGITTSPTGSEKNDAGVGKSPGTSPRMTVKMSAVGCRRVAPRTPSPKNPRATEISSQVRDGGSPKASSPEARSRTPQESHGTKKDSDGNSPQAVAAGGGTIFGDEESKTDALAANDSFEATVVVSPGGEAVRGATGGGGRSTGHELEKTLMDLHAGNGGAKGHGKEFTGDGLDQHVGGWVDTGHGNDPDVDLSQTFVDNTTSEGDSVFPDNVGHQPRIKKKNRVAPMYLGQTADRTLERETTVTGREGARGGRGEGCEVWKQSGTTQSGGRVDSSKGEKSSVTEKKISVDAGVQYVRPPEGSEGWAEGQVGGKCGCSMM